MPSGWRMRAHCTSAYVRRCSDSRPRDREEWTSKFESTLVSPSKQAAVFVCPFKKKAAVFVFEIKSFRTGTSPVWVMGKSRLEFGTPLGMRKCHLVVSSGFRKTCPKDLETGLLFLGLHFGPFSVLTGKLKGRTVAIWEDPVSHSPRFRSRPTEDSTLWVAPIQPDRCTLAKKFSTVP